MENLLRTLRPEPREAKPFTRETTLIYTHLTPLNEARTRAALDVLHRAVAA